MYLTQKAHAERRPERLEHGKVKSICLMESDICTMHLSQVNQAGVKGW